MTTLSNGQQVNIIGPVGNGFSVPEGKKLAVLVSGGMGAPPLLHLARTLPATHKEIEIIAFAGAKSVSELPFEMQDTGVSETPVLTEFETLGIKSFTATDDGSAGFNGFVTDCVADWLKKTKINTDETIIYACGPEAMLSSMAKTAKQYGIACQVSMERNMACGIGLCQSCAVEVKQQGSDETVYKLCCKDGPVFDSQEVVFGE